MVCAYRAFEPGLNQWRCRSQSVSSVDPVTMCVHVSTGPRQYGCGEPIKASMPVESWSSVCGLRIMPGPHDGTMRVVKNGGG